MILKEHLCLNLGRRSHGTQTNDSSGLIEKDLQQLRQCKGPKKSPAYWLGRLNKPRQVCRFTNNKLGTDEVVDPVQGRQKYYGRAMRPIMNIECILQSQM